MPGTNNPLDRLPENNLVVYLPTGSGQVIQQLVDICRRNGLNFDLIVEEEDDLPARASGGTVTVTVNPEFSKSFEDLLCPMVAGEIAKAFAQLADIIGVGIDEDVAHAINASLDAQH